MLQDDNSRSVFAGAELAPVLALGLVATFLSMVGFISLLNISSNFSEVNIEPGIFWILGSVLFFLLAVCIVAILKYLQIVAKLNSKEKGLRRDIQLLEGFFDTNPSMMWVKNIEGSYNLVNQAFREFTGSTGVPVEKIDHSKIFVDTTAALMKNQEQQVVKFRSPMEFEAVWHAAEGSKHYSILRFPLVNEDGEVFAIGGIANDRTDQVNARRALRESEKQFRSLVESAADAILIANDRGDILLANKQAERIFALSRGLLM